MNRSIDRSNAGRAHSSHFKREKQYLKQYYKSIGQKIKSAREEMGMTQADLAGLLNLAPTAVTNYESGTRQVPIHTISEISQILKKPIYYFLGPGLDSEILVTEALKNTVERFTDAVYIKDFIVLDGDQLKELEHPHPMIPVPPFIANDHNFALCIYNEKVSNYSYLICKYFISDLQHEAKTEAKADQPSNLPLEEFISNISVKAKPPEPDTLVLAYKNNSATNFELVLFKDVTPDESYDGTEYDQYSVNVYAVVLSKVERLVK